MFPYDTEKEEINAVHSGLLGTFSDPQHLGSTDLYMVSRLIEDNAPARVAVELLLRHFQITAHERERRVKEHDWKCAICSLWNRASEGTCSSPMCSKRSP